MVQLYLQGNILHLWELLLEDLDLSYHLFTNKMMDLVQESIKQKL